MTHAELLTRFSIEHFERNSISAQRRKMTLFTLDELASLLDGRSLLEVTPSDLMRWQGHQLKRGLAPNTVRNRETMVAAFHSWALTAGLISFEHATQLKSVRVVRGGARPPSPRPYKREEIERLREALGTKYPLIPTKGVGMYALRRYTRGRWGSDTDVVIRKHARRLQYEAQISLALEEGLRCTEIYNLTIARMHPGNDGVVVMTAKGEPGERREREVPYTAHSRLCVREWLDFRAIMAPGHAHPWLALIASNPVGPQTFERFTYALGLIPDGPWSWHRLRHTFATERLRAGLPLEKLQVMLGHAQLQQTLAYAEIVNADVREEALRTEAAFARALGTAA